MSTTTVPTTTVAPAPARGIEPPAGPPGPLTTALAVAGRSVRRFVRTPQLLVVSTLTGAMFLLIFRYVFGGAVETGGVRYVDFLVPGYVVTSVLFTGSEAASGVAEDMEQGVTDRFRSLPVSRTAVMAGRVLAEWGLLTLGLAVTTAIGVAVGFRPDGSPLEAAAAFGLASLFGFAMMWLFALIGLVSGNVQAAQGMSLMVFPLSFVSSAFVPVESMPGWMQPVAEHQPVTVVTNAVRSLALGDPAAAGLDGSTAGWVGLALVWIAGLVAVFAPLAVQRYRRP
jgi:ABC-2 type transport system permease protein